MEEKTPATGVTAPSGEYDSLAKESLWNLLEIIRTLDIKDNGFAGRGDMEERIILVRRKERRDSHKPFDKFNELRSDTNTKCDLLINYLEQLVSTLSRIPTASLSEILLEERLLKHDDILEETMARQKILAKREIRIIIAGETNGGKSTCLNVILGEEILPTDVLHCTLAVTIIKYSQTYSIETLDHSGVVETHPCQGTKDAHDKLAVLVARQDQKARVQGSMYKEITLKMPAAILKSGMILVDTPGIGEMEEMDNVTMNYIRSTRADGFIYIIKSDTAGGVQEDRLLSFLRAIQEDFKKDSVESAIDPRAALFVCNRWDTISPEGVEIVKKNALTKLDIVWPGFRTEQALFFSSKKAKLHLDADPEYITDALNEFLLGINTLFNRVAHNSIQSQYKWIKSILPALSRHLSAMINHCIRSNEDLEELFRTVAAKQEILSKKSNEQCPDLTHSLVDYKARLMLKFKEIFSNIQPREIEDFPQLVSLITESFLEDGKNKKEADEWIVNSLIRHCDKMIQDSRVLEEMESESKHKIEEHIGLFQEQITEITELVKGQTETPHNRRARLSSQFGSFDSPKGSSGGGNSWTEMFEHTTMNPSELNVAVGNLLKKRKKSEGMLKIVPNFKRKMMSKVQSATGSVRKKGGKNHKDIPAYVERRIEKYAKRMRDDEDIIEGFAAGYLHLIELYIQSAVDHIPHFIGVNTKLIDNIRDHRREFHENKERMKAVMDDLEPFREQLRGYGLLYMEDLSAGNVFFNTENRINRVNIDQLGLSFSMRFNDSGFYECGSSRSKIRGFWTQSISAVIKIDGTPSDITLKTYTTLIDNKTLFSEIASLRYLEHTNLAPFFGMTRIACTTDDSADPSSSSSLTSSSSPSSEKVSAFIFKGNLMSARMFLSNKFVVLRDFLKHFVNDLIAGLDYIHRENMVHLELNLDTVMVSFPNGVVQLCQQCKPRSIRLPKDLSIPTKSSVCLSPPVLQGAEYGINDDIYAFVIMLWELLFPNNPPFAEERQWSLKRFIDEVCPSQMLGPKLDELEASEAVLAVFKAVFLSGRRSHCLTTGDIKSRLDEMTNDPLFKTKPLRRQIPIKRLSRDRIDIFQDTPIKSERSASIDAGVISDRPIPPPRPNRKRASVPNISLSTPLDEAPLSERLAHQLLLGISEDNTYSQGSNPTNTEFVSTPGVVSQDIQDSGGRSPRIRIRKQSAPAAPALRLLDYTKPQEEETVVFRRSSLTTEDKIRPTSLHGSGLCDFTDGMNAHNRYRKSPIMDGANPLTPSDSQEENNTENRHLHPSASSSMRKINGLPENHNIPQILVHDDNNVQDIDGTILRHDKTPPSFEAKGTLTVEEPSQHIRNSLSDLGAPSNIDCKSQENFPQCLVKATGSLLNVLGESQLARRRSFSGVGDKSDNKDYKSISENIGKNKKKPHWNPFKKSNLQKQSHVDNKDNTRLMPGKGHMLSTSVPGNLNKLPKGESDARLKGGLFGMFGRDKAKKTSKERKDPLSKGSNSKSLEESSPNLSRLAIDQHRRWSESKPSNFSDEGSDTPTFGRDKSNSLPLQDSERDSLTNSPTLTHKWHHRDSQKVLGIGGGESADRMGLNNRISSSNSLYSTYISSIMSERARMSSSTSSDEGDQRPSRPSGKASCLQTHYPNRNDILDISILTRSSSTKSFTHSFTNDDSSFDDDLLFESKLGCSGLSVVGAFPAMNDNNATRGSSTPTKYALPPATDLAKNVTVTTISEDPLSQGINDRVVFSTSGAFPTMNNDGLNDSKILINKLPSLEDFAESFTTSRISSQRGFGNARASPFDDAPGGGSKPSSSRRCEVEEDVSFTTPNAPPSDGDFKQDLDISDAFRSSRNSMVDMSVYGALPFRGGNQRSSRGNFHDFEINKSQKRVSFESDSGDVLPELPFGEMSFMDQSLNGFK